MRHAARDDAQSVRGSSKELLLATTLEAFATRIDPQDQFARRGSLIHLQRGDEGGLGNINLAELAHPLFTLLLLVQKFAFA